ncbi:MAG TPA: 50S ribosomal protein L22 [Candidatus Omnitrophica bacterium]|nr:50S ribosomal protein L22 [Candidatus Omnitrophota bacterium]
MAQAKGKYVRVSPMRARQVVDLIRGKDVPSSLAILTHLNKGCSKTINKILGSAVSNAKQKGLSEEQLFVSKITANQGSVWKRYRAASFGRAMKIQKKTTHIIIELDLITK